MLFAADVTEKLFVLYARGLLASPSRTLDNEVDFLFMDRFEVLDYCSFLLRRGS